MSYFQLVILCGLFVVEALSVIIQTTSYKLTGKRVFRMAPIHHHFEKLDGKNRRSFARFLDCVKSCSRLSRSQA